MFLTSMKQYWNELSCFALLKNSSFCANERNKSHTWSHFMSLSISSLTITKILMFQMFSSFSVAVLMIMLKHNFTNCFHVEGLLITTLRLLLSIDYVTKVKILFGCLFVWEVWESSSLDIQIQIFQSILLEIHDFVINSFLLQNYVSRPRRCNFCFIVATVA